MSLVTRCPKCASAFSVSADQLRVYEGLVRCGQCKNVFDGYDNLDATLPTLTKKVVNQSTAMPPSDASTLPPFKPDLPFEADLQFESDHPFEEDLQFEAEPPYETDPPYEAEPSFKADPPQVFRSRQSQLHVQSGNNGPDSRNTVIDPPFGLGSDHELTREPKTSVMGESRMRGDTPSDFGRETPSFMVTGLKPTGVTHFFWHLGVVLALIVLTLQAAYIYRNDLSVSVPALKPLLAHACQWVSCEVHYPKHAERISIRASSLQQIASVQDGKDMNAFKLRFTLQNRFDNPQAWPHLLVLLTDASGTVVVRKIVPPIDYVPRNLIETAFMAQQETNFVVDLQVKGLAISGFEIDKFFP